MKFLPAGYIYYIRELAHAIIEDDKEKAKRVLIDLDKKQVFAKWALLSILLFFIGMAILLVVVAWFLGAKWYEF